jgi:hypothetical protein
VVCVTADGSESMKPALEICALWRICGPLILRSGGGDCI